MEIFFILSGLGLCIFLAGLGIGISEYLMKLEPCKHNWEKEAQMFMNGTHYANKYRCTICCKSKEV